MNNKNVPNSKKQILCAPTIPFDPVGVSSASEILTRMQDTAFQGKQLGLSFEIWKKMLADDCIIMMVTYPAPWCRPA